MSIVPTEPNSLPSVPALAAMVTLLPLSSAARVCAAVWVSASAFSSSARRCTNAVWLVGVVVFVLCWGCFFFWVFFLCFVLWLFCLFFFCFFFFLLLFF